VAWVARSKPGDDGNWESRDLEQERRGSSSLSALTVSKVTTGRPSPRGNKGTPLRFVPKGVLYSARRANSETTSPAFGFLVLGDQLGGDPYIIVNGKSRRHFSHAAIITHYARYTWRGAVSPLTSAPCCKGD
jgi:hypothetical protein